MRHTKHVVAALGLLLACSAPLPAQEPDWVRFASQPDLLAEPSLDPIIVTPEDDSPPVLLPRPTQESALSQNLRPSPDSVRSPTNPFSDSMTYPNLQQEVFGGLNSALRGTRSVFDDPRHVSIITDRDLLERQPMNMAQTIEGEVGVLVQRTGAGQASPFIRGLTGPQTLILIDGIRMNNSTFRFGPNQYFATIDPGMIERVEIVRGPQSVLWGSDAIGGVINVVTRSADGYGEYRDAGGDFINRFSTADLANYSRVNVEGSNHQGGIFGGASYMNVNNMDRGGNLGRQPFTDYSQYAGDLKFDYLLDTDQLLTVSLQHFDQENVPRSDAWPTEDRRFNPQQRDMAYIRWQGYDTGGMWDAFSITGSFQRQKEGSIRRRPPESPTVDYSEFDVETTGLQFVFMNDLLWLGELTYGVDMFHDEVDALAYRENNSTGSSTPRVPQFPTDSYYDRFGVFLQWDVAVTDRLSAISGVRYSHINLGSTVALYDPNQPGFPNVPPVDTPIHPSFQDWTGSVGLVYEVYDWLNLVGSVSEGFRAPSLDELTAVSSNVNEGVDIPTVGLRPETSINYETGLKFNSPKLRGQVFYFWTDLDGLSERVLVATDPATGINYFQRQNIGNAYVNGFEMAGEYVLEDGWALYGNYWYTLGQNLTDNEPLSRIPPMQGTLGLKWRDAETASYWDYFVWMVDKQDRLSDRDRRDSRIPLDGTPGYATFNVNHGRQLDRHQLITVGLYNILDKAYRVHGSGVDGPGITAMFGYQWAH